MALGTIVIIWAICLAIFLVFWAIMPRQKDYPDLNDNE